MNREFHRREFLKLAGLGAAALTASPNVVGRTKRGSLIESQEQYSGFTVEEMDANSLPYQFDPDALKAMSEKQTCFSRNVWDPLRQTRPRENIRHRNLVEGEGKIPNQTRLDYALMAAAWTYARSGGITYRWDGPFGGVRGESIVGLGPWDPADIDMNWEDASRAVKHAALFYGASLAGIAKLNPLWLYSDAFSPTREDRGRTVPVIRDTDRFEQAEDAWYIPHSMNRVIVVAFEEDYYGIANSPGRLASAATGDGYSRMAVTATTLAEFIRALGYRALPAGNGVGLSIPMAIDAGLGELGRMGLLVTPKYGPRVRIAKVITDMPLIPDKPIRFGVTEFCETCMLCADDCPSGSVTKGPQAWKGDSPSNNAGVYKWYVEPETCFDFNGFSCSNCKRVCPFTKPNNSWLHRLVRLAIDAKVKPLNDIMVTLDQASGYGKQMPDTDFWKMDGQKSITARESM